MEIENKETFNESTNAKWDSVKEKIYTVMRELKDEIEKASESKLESSPFKDSNDSWLSVIANINIHNAYHTGQIIYIRKLQGSWNPEQGVN